MKYLSSLSGFVVLLAMAQAIYVPSGLYSEDDSGDMALQHQFSADQLQRATPMLLEMLGLNPPSPSTSKEEKSVPRRSAASQFLQQVYLSKNSKLTRFGFAQDDEESSAMRNQRFAKNMKLQEFNVDQDDIAAMQNSDEIISFTSHGHPFSDRVAKFSMDKQFWFNVSDISSLDQVYSAELRLWKKRMEYKKESNDVEGYVPKPGKEEDIIRVSVYQIVSLESNGKPTAQLVKVDEGKTTNSLQGWLRFDVTSAFRQWISQPNSNYGLVISTKSAKYGKEVPLAKIGISNGSGEVVEHQPFLVAFLKTATVNRATGSHLQDILN